MDPLIILHLTALSFWLGVVSVEFIFERAKIGKEVVIRLHKLTDRYVELPIIAIVFITGLMLWARTSWSLDYFPKVFFGFLAVASNIFCYYYVETRKLEKENFKHHSLILFKMTIIGLFSFVMALILGGRHAGWW